ncbi:oligoendopeptidase F [Pontibacillus yanchengensis]|uniref:Oligoendopeptidase F n=2 Tax=Pontibacillus yanchengensis TaxID=462910 RepID=A0ACC7VF17_9BACI|nr:oligoendopeptidase F [Pontibacillus yanchengensis]MYL32221.1 oligoendopeptidase F [Pontibacillus yanchengensis]MYL52801.1 oligoendopeptidase F [Pontibacillus yanchengensis]
MEMAKELPKREEIPEERTWRLEDIFSSDEEWNQEFEAIKQLIPTITEYQGKLHESADTLYNLLKLQDEVANRVGKLFTYAHMRNDQDTTNSHYQEMNTRAENLLTQVGSAMSYIDPEILAMEEGKVGQFISEKEELKLYEKALNEITRQRPHTLSEQEEALLAKASEVMSTPTQTFGALNNADLTFPTIQDEEGNDVDLTHGRYIRFLQSKDRSVRKQAFEAMYETFGNFKNTFSTTLSGSVKKHNFSASVRNYESARHAALDNNNIPEKVYDNLVEAVNDRLPALQRYVDLRKEVLGVDELHMYDLYADLVQDVDMDIPYDQAQELVLKGLEPLGDEYVNIVKEGYKNRWIDVEENKGKRSGAYSSGTYGTNPYILMNWQNNLNNLFTLAHELGHSLHSYYSAANQPYRYGNYSIFVAEVASTCNEALLNDYLLKETEDEKKKLYLLNHFLEGFRGTVFRQTMFAEFEHDIHKREQNGEALTADKLTELYHDLNQKYFGNNIVVDDEIGLEWARIPHFYYNYYVYQYATGYSAATALASQILKEGDDAVSRYKDFLKAGSSDYPIEVLKHAGVDMTSKQPIEEALDVFEEKLAEFEKLIKA